MRVLNTFQGFLAGIRHLGAQFPQKREVIQDHCIVAGLLVWLNLRRIHIVTLVVAEAPADSHIRLDTLQPIEVLPAYPTLFDKVLSVYSVIKEPHTLPVKVVGEDMTIPSVKQHLMRHSTAPGKEVIEVLHALMRNGFHQPLHYP